MITIILITRTMEDFLTEEVEEDYMALEIRIIIMVVIDRPRPQQDIAVLGGDILKVGGAHIL